jgi:hypothetical protein
MAAGSQGRNDQQVESISLIALASACRQKTEGRSIKQEEVDMNQFRTAVAVAAFLFAPLTVIAQQSPPQSGNTPAHETTTVTGCLQRSRGNYVLVEDQTNLAYVLKGVGNKLEHEVHHQIEVKGRVLPGTVKTGIRSEKAGSNPADTTHGVDGVPFQVADVQADVRTVSEKCKAADQQ